MTTLTTVKDDPTPSFVARSTRKLHVAQRVYRREGLSSLVGELTYQANKPFLLVYSFLCWWWYRALRKRSFTVQGHQINVLPNDHGVSRELAVYKVHEPLATLLLRQVLNSGMNVVDIGSNIGYYALLEASLIGPQGKVVAIEPVPENGQQLLENIQRNGYRNIFVHRLAIGDRTGKAEMHISRKSNWHSLAQVPWPTTKLQVPISTLDDLLSGQHLASVDLVRMDLEGYEVAVIKGMQRTLQRYSPRLLVELHPHLVGTPLMIQYLRSLEKLGYTVEWMIEQERDVPLRWRFINVEHPTMEELMSDSRVCKDPRALTVLFCRH